MRLDYATLLSPAPIKLSIGTIRKPTLKEIFEITYEKFGFYELLLKLTPIQFYTVLIGDAGKKVWDSLSEDEKEDLSIFQLIIEYEPLRNMYIEMLNFFFVENVLFSDNTFILCTGDSDDLSDLNIDDIKGVITKEYFNDVLGIIQQTCCIDDGDNENPIFKNKTAEKLYKKISKAKKHRKKIIDKNYSLPNIISSVASRHKSLNLLNIWGLTIYQLMDTFNRLQVGEIYDIDSRRVSVWGDEKKTFDATLWYKNEFK